MMKKAIEPHPGEIFHLVIISASTPIYITNPDSIVITFLYRKDNFLRTEITHIYYFRYFNLCLCVIKFNIHQQIYEFYKYIQFENYIYK
jgi:hypothetical protein